MKNIQKFYGIDVNLVDEVESVAYSHLLQLIRDQINSGTITLPEDTVVYVKQVAITYDQTHFSVIGLENRLSRLSVRVEITKKLRQSNKMQFLDLQCQSDPDVLVKRYKHNIDYSLQSSYIISNDHYTDYIAIAVESPEKYVNKTIKVYLNAHPTSAYREHLVNKPHGIITTILDFKLSKRLQLTFDF